MSNPPCQPYATSALSCHIFGLEYSSRFQRNYLSTCQLNFSFAKGDPVLTLRGRVPVDRMTRRRTRELHVCDFDHKGIDGVRFVTAAGLQFPFLNERGKSIDC
jgi:hypothetical protein